MVVWKAGSAVHHVNYLQDAKAEQTAPEQQLPRIGYTGRGIFVKSFFQLFPVAGYRILYGTHPGGEEEAAEPCPANHGPGGGN
jgi:hypothetical protein